MFVTGSFHFFVIFINKLFCLQVSYQCLILEWNFRLKILIYVTLSQIFIIFSHRRQKPFGIPSRSFLFRKNFVDEMTHKQHRHNNDMHHKTKLNNTKSIFTLFLFTYQFTWYHNFSRIISIQLWKMELSEFLIEISFSFQSQYVS